MPDLALLIGPEYTAQKDKSNEIMGKVVSHPRQSQTPAGGRSR